MAELQWRDRFLILSKFSYKSGAAEAIASAVFLIVGCEYYDRNPDRRSRHVLDCVRVLSIRDIQNRNGLAVFQPFFLLLCGIRNWLSLN